MKAFSAREAKYNFGRMIDTARGEPVVVEKHGRPFVVVMGIEEFRRLKEKATAAAIAEGEVRGTKNQEADREDLGVSNC